MANSVRSRTLLFTPQPPKPFPFSSLSPSSSSSSSSSSSVDIMNTSHYYSKKPDLSFSANIKNTALHFLNCCKTSTHLFQIQAHLITSDLFQDPSFSGRLLKLSTNLCNDLYFTLSIFKCIDFPDAFCVNTVIKNYSCGNYYRKAVLFYIEMLRYRNFFPNSFTFPPLISACTKLNCLSLGQMCHGQALKYGVENVLPVQNTLIHFYACCGHMDVAQKVFGEMLIRDLVTWNTIIDGFAKVGEMELAHKLFDAMPQRNVVSWNVMISGYLNFRSPGNALKLFREMMGMGFESNDTTGVNVIAACGRSNRLREGRSVHAFLVKRLPNMSLIIDTAMVDMYSKCGKVDLAQVIFDRMPNKNLVSWNTMILGHCIHANPVDGLSLFAEMVDKCRQKDDLAVNFGKNVKIDEGNLIFPDEVTFIGVLCACARKGMLIEGINYFSQMINVFHVKPNFAHYWCMANLLAKVGLMQEAVGILKNIPTDEDMSQESSLWAGILGSCRFQGDVILGEQIAKELIELDPRNFSYYNLLVNVYSVAGRWEEIARTKDMMKQRGIKRVPCSNLKDLKEIVHNVDVGCKLSKDSKKTLR